MKRKVVVDGSNVAFEEVSGGGKPKISNLTKVRRGLEERGLEPTVFVDASLYHTVDDPEQLDALINRGEIHQVPAGTHADYWVLQTVDNTNALVASNDRFAPCQDKYVWIDERRVPFMSIDGQVELYEPALDAVSDDVTSSVAAK
jgi:hypothetical protein